MVLEVVFQKKVTCLLLVVLACCMHSLTAAFRGPNHSGTLLGSSRASLRLCSLVVYLFDCLRTIGGLYHLFSIPGRSTNLWRILLQTTVHYQLENMMDYRMAWGNVRGKWLQIVYLSFFQLESLSLTSSISQWLRLQMVSIHGFWKWSYYIHRYRL